MIETAVTKMFRVTKVEEELSYLDDGKTQVKTYNFTNNLGMISIVLFMKSGPLKVTRKAKENGFSTSSEVMADEPSSEVMAIDSRDVYG